MISVISVSVPLELNTEYLEFCNVDYLCIKETNRYNFT